MGQNSGVGGVQTIHRNLFNSYRKNGFNVFIIDTLQSLIKCIYKTSFFSNTKIVFFSGLSLVFSPIFFRVEKHFFFVHGFYIFENINNLKRFLKKFFYEIFIYIFLFIYRWVYCVAPSPLSGLVNSLQFSKNIYVLEIEKLKYENIFVGVNRLKK